MNHAPSACYQSKMAFCAIKDWWREKLFDIEFDSDNDFSVCVKKLVQIRIQNANAIHHNLNVGKPPSH
jgi:hypothetical protein